MGARHPSRYPGLMERPGLSAPSRPGCWIQGQKILFGSLPALKHPAPAKVLPALGPEAWRPSPAPPGQQGLTEWRERGNGASLARTHQPSLATAHPTGTRSFIDFNFH